MSKYLIFIGLFVLIFVNRSESQILVDHQFHKFQNYLYYFSDTANRPHLKYYTVFTCPDSTSKDSAYITSHALGKIIFNNSNGWNLGKQVLCTNGDTAVFNVIFYIGGPDKKDSLESAIQYVMNNMPTRVFDTTNRSHNILTSIGASSVTQLAYLMNTFSSEKFYKNFQTFYPIDFASNSIVGTAANWLAIKQPLNSWYFSGGSGGFPYNVGFTTDAFDSALVHNPSTRSTKLTLVSGQNYSTLTHDSAYYKTGNDATNNPWIWFVDTTGCIDLTAQKIIVDSFMTIDWGGFWKHASYSTWYYFDSKGDPLHGDLLNDSTSGNTSIGGGLYYIDDYRRQHLIGVDFTRDSSTTMWDVSEIWVCTSPIETGADTVGIVLGDSAMSATFIANFTNNTATTVNVITSGGSYGWQRVWQGHVHSQHALVNIRRQPSNSNETNLTGIVFYGHPLAGQGINTYQYDPSYIAAADTNRAVIERMTAANAYNNYPPEIMTPFDLRMGINTQFKGSNDSLVIQMQQDSTSRNFTDSIKKVLNPSIHQYYSWQGPVTRVYNQTSDFLQRPVDSVGADRRSFSSYKTIAKLFYDEAFAFGNNPSANNAYFKSIGGWIKANNTLWGAELGSNEPNGITFTNYWQDPISVGVMVAMNIDGANNMFGPGYGIKNADPNFKAYLPATAGIDNHFQIAVLRFLQYFYHTAHPPIDYITYHSYPQATKKGIGLTTNESIGQYVTTPSNESYFQDKVSAIQMGYGYWHGYIAHSISEEGADKSFDRTTTSSGQFDTTLAGIIQYTSFSQEQSLGLSQVSATFENASTSLSENMVYSYIDFDAPNSAFLYHTFSGSGFRWIYYHPDFSHIDSIKTFGQYNYYLGIMNSMPDFVHVQTLDSNSNGLWRLKFRSRSNPAHVKWVLWNDNASNSNIVTSIPIGATVGTVTKQQGQFNSLSLTSTTVTPSGGVLNVTVNSQHTIIDDTEAPSTDNNYILFQQGRRIKFFSP